MLRRHMLRASSSSLASTSSSSKFRWFSTDSEEEEDQILKCSSRSGKVTVYSILATNVVLEAQQRHRATRTATAVLGRSLMGALMLRLYETEAATVQVSMHCGGPIGQFISIASGGGLVKGFVDDSECDFPFIKAKFDAKGTIGQYGKMVVALKNEEKWKSWARTEVPIEHGEVAEGIGRYIAGTRELKCAAAFGVLFDKRNTVNCARGYFVEISNSASSKTVERVQQNIEKMPMLNVYGDVSPKEIISRLLDGLGAGEINFLDPPRYGPCGIEGRKVLRAKIGDMGFWEIRKMLREQGYVQVECTSCNEIYRYREEELDDYVPRGVSDSDEE